jgi:hypothetical protein
MYHMDIFSPGAFTGIRPEMKLALRVHIQNNDMFGLVVVLQMNVSEFYHVENRGVHGIVIPPFERLLFATLIVYTD